eukprot:GILJ01013870.1.p1 GENE.GILJ01013870.1~~GILJ01013870.1.p1  ORF type:complete len:104 (+),score=4.91 GILJ01013870.1:58-369(+)
MSARPIGKKKKTKWVGQRPYASRTLCSFREYEMCCTETRCQDIKGIWHALIERDALAVDRAQHTPRMSCLFTTKSEALRQPVQWEVVNSSIEHLHCLQQPRLV